MDNLDGIRSFFENDAFAKYLGVELVEVSKGKAKAKLNIRPEHLNSINVVHGGVISALADVVFAVASNSYGTIALGINENISYVKAATGGTLIAVAEEVSLNPKLATYDVSITEEDGDTIAVFHGTVYKKKEKFDPEFDRR